MATRVRTKAQTRAENKDKRPMAIAKYIRISPYKVREVLNLIRGKDYNVAVATLETVNKSSSEPILKVLKSAGANAENNLNMNKDNLFVAECYADGGSTLKRIMPRAKGSADRILKRTSSITIRLDAKEVK